MATAEMTTAEFIDVHKLPPDDLRKRFGLPSSCDPTVTALTTDPAANRVTVAVECRSRPDLPAAQPTSGERPRQ